MFVETCVSLLLLSGVEVLLMLLVVFGRWSGCVCSGGWYAHSSQCSVEFNIGHQHGLYFECSSRKNGALVLVGLVVFFSSLSSWIMFFPVPLMESSDNFSLIAMSTYDFISFIMICILS